MDYSILIKRNFIIMMNKCYDDTKRDENMKHWASAYTDVLLQLPLYPILSKEDVSHLQIHDKIREAEAAAEEAAAQEAEEEAQEAQEVAEAAGAIGRGGARWSRGTTLTLMI